MMNEIVQRELEGPNDCNVLDVVSSVVDVPSPSSSLSSILQFGIDFLQQQQQLLLLETTATATATTTTTTTSSSTAIAVSTTSDNGNYTIDDNNKNDDDDTTNIAIHHHHHEQQQQNNDGRGSNMNSIQYTREYRDLIMALQRLQQYSTQQQQQQCNNHHPMRMTTTTTKTTPNTTTITTTATTATTTTSISFFQSIVTDEILLRIFSYSNCVTIIKGIMRTCQRWYTLSKIYAIKYITTKPIIQCRQLPYHPMQLLYAYEYIQHGKILTNDDDDNNTTTTIVSQQQQVQVQQQRIPRLVISMILPSYPIQITNCGDIDYNGIYYCTSCNGNGFVFTKSYHIRTSTTTTATIHTNNNNNNNSNRRIQHHHHHEPNNNNNDCRYMDITNRTNIIHGCEIPNQALRCIISKQFSNTDIFWYLGKEVWASSTTTMDDDDDDDDDIDDDSNNNRRNNNDNNNNNNNTTESIKVVYSFWARLMQLNDLDYMHNNSNSNNKQQIDDIDTLLHYPSFTSALIRSQSSSSSTATIIPNNNDAVAWQCLDSTLHLIDTPPIVELL